VPAAEAFTGRVALVTGGSRGIGAAICRRLAAEGAAVGVAYGSDAEAAAAVVDAISSEGGSAAAFGEDLGDPAAPARLVGAVEARLGPVDVLVANHGLGRRVPYEDLDIEGFDRTLAVNLRAPFLLAQRVLPGMRERGFGRLLFISSMAAFRGGFVGPDYAASKAGLHALAHFLASRVAADGVTVNVLAPGLIATDMLPGDADQLAASLPVRRLGQPDEVADLAAATLRNAYLTSKVLSLDGGLYPR
jgi:3-oxoacyl-[acyl-carrier protein] reductase